MVNIVMVVMEVRSHGDPRVGKVPSPHYGGQLHAGSQGQGGGVES